MTLIDLTTGIPVAIVHGSVLEMRSNRTFTNTFDITPATTGVRSTVTSTGAWTQAGTSVTLVPNTGGCNDQGILENNGSTLRFPSDCDFGLEAVYTRR